MAGRRIASGAQHKSVYQQQMSDWKGLERRARAVLAPCQDKLEQTLY